MTEPTADRLEHCSAVEFAANGDKWFDRLQSNVLSNREGLSLSDRSTALQRMCTFLQQAREFPGLSKKLSTGLLSKFLNKFLNQLARSDDARKITLHDLKLVETCLQCYPNTLAASTTLYDSVAMLLAAASKCGKIERILAARCYALFPKLCQAGEKGVKHADNFSNQLQYCIIVAHRSLAALTAGTTHEGMCASDSLQTEPAPTWIPGNKWKFGDLVDPTDRSAAFGRFELAMWTLCEMISCPVVELPVKIPVLPLIDLIDCSISVNPNDLPAILQPMRAEFVQTSELALKLLEIMAQSLRVLLCPQLNRVYSLLLPQLHLHDSSAVANLREKIYSTLAVVSADVGIGRFLIKNSPRLANHILDDLKPIEQESAPVAEPPAKRQKKKGNQASAGSVESILDSAVVRPPDTMAKERLVAAAVDCVCTILSVPLAAMFDPSFHRQLNRFVASTLIRIHAGETLRPYTNARNRDCLYKLLRALVSSNNVKVAPPLHPAIALFTSGLRDPNENIRATCQAGLSACALISRPKVPPLENPIYDAGEPSKRSTSNAVILENDEITIDDDEPPPKKHTVATLAPSNQPAKSVWNGPLPDSTNAAAADQNDSNGIFSEPESDDSNAGSPKTANAPQAMDSALASVRSETTNAKPAVNSTEEIVVLSDDDSHMPTEPEKVPERIKSAVSTTEVRGIEEMVTECHTMSKDVRAMLDDFVAE